MTRYPDLRKPQQRYPNLCGALRAALLALRRRATIEEWEEAQEEFPVPLHMRDRIVGELEQFLHMLEEDRGRD